MHTGIKIYKNTFHFDEIPVICSHDDLEEFGGWGYKTISYYLKGNI